MTHIIATTIPMTAAVGLAMLAAHWSPGRRGWQEIARYVYGVGIIGAAGIVTWALNQSMTSGILLAVLALYTVTAGAATWISYLLDRANSGSGSARATSAESAIDKLHEDGDE